MDVGIILHGEHIFLGRDRHREGIVTALKMLMREDRAADNGQIGVGADKIMRKLSDKIKQLAEYRRVDHHRDMLAVEHDAVLMIVAVGRILQIPVARIDLDRDGAQILARRVILPTRVAHVLGAKLTLGIRDGSGRACLGDIARILLGF